MATTIKGAKTWVICAKINKVLYNADISQPQMFVIILVYDSLPEISTLLCKISIHGQLATIGSAIKADVLNYLYGILITSV